MAIIYFTNHQKRQLVDFSKQHPCIIYVKNCHECESLHSNKTKSISVLTLEFSKWDNYVTTKKCFKQFHKKMFSLRDITKIISDQ